jgi:hypothetical protein
LSEVLKEWRGLFKYSSVIHMGYDELPDGAWAKSPGCLQLADELRQQKGQAGAKEKEKKEEKETKETKEEKEAKKTKEGVVLVNEFFKRKVQGLLSELEPPVRMAGWCTHFSPLPPRLSSLSLYALYAEQGGRRSHCSRLFTLKITTVTVQAVVRGGLLMLLLMVLLMARVLRILEGIIVA